MKIGAMSELSPHCSFVFAVILCSLIVLSYICTEKTDFEVWQRDYTR